MRVINTIEPNVRKSDRNKTIDFEVSYDDSKYERMFLTIDDLSENPHKLDITVNADTFLALSFISEKSVDLVIVDPPYNLAKNYHGNKFDKSDELSYERFTRRWIEKVLPLMKPNASIYVCCDWESSLTIGSVLKDYFIVRNRITWQREKGRGAKSNWKNAMEDIWFATLSKDYKFNVDDVKQRRRVIAPYRNNGSPKDWDETPNGNFRNSFPSNFWDDISIPYWSMPENTAHPTQKPEKLIAKLILASSNAGDVILDPFLGSGTTSVVAKKLSRRYIGIEFNPQYCAWAEYRLKKADIITTIQGYTDGVFWERNTLSEQNKNKNNGNLFMMEEENNDEV